jgi:hypothetical protein
MVCQVTAPFNRMMGGTAVDSQRTEAVTLAKRLLIDVLWKTANIEVDGITFPDTEEIFDGCAPQGMRVDEIEVVIGLPRYDD